MMNANDELVPVPTPCQTAPEAVEELSSGVAYLLAEMKRRKETEAQPEVFPERLPVKSIAEMPELFQPRGSKGIDERHVSDLARGIDTHGELEAVLVTWIGKEAFLIDGHHRLAAYRHKKVTRDIPVRHFHGTVEEAVLEAGKANSRAKLPMSTQGRLNYAWKLVRLGTFSKRQTVEASGVSDRQVAIMRGVRKKLGESADSHAEWWQAHEIAKGKELPGMSPEEHDTFLDSRASAYADKLSKAFGNKFSMNPELAARALEIHFGRNAKALAGELLSRVGVADEEDEEGDF